MRVTGFDVARHVDAVAVGEVVRQPFYRGGEVNPCVAQRARWLTASAQQPQRLRA
jgi:hypothetical protein